MRLRGSTNTFSESSHHAGSDGGTNNDGAMQNSEQSAEKLAQAVNELLDGMEPRKVFMLYKQFAFDLREKFESSGILPGYASKKKPKSQTDHF